MNMLISRLGRPLIGRTGQPLLSRRSPNGFTPYRFRPPATQNPLTVINVAPTGLQEITGGRANQDLLLVMPNEPFRGQCHVLQSYCNIYLIGGVFDPDASGTLTINGKNFRGIGVALRLYPHPNAVSPKIFVARVKVKTAKIDFGDFLQTGAGGAQANWPDIYRQFIDIDRIPGWDEPTATGMTHTVSHSDMFKIDGGGIRKGYAAHYRAVVGYQEYVGPTWASNFRPHPNAEMHYYDTQLICYDTPAHTSVLGHTYPGNHDNNALFFTRGSDPAAAGEYNPAVFHEGGTDGAGVWLQPNAGQNLLGHVHPGSGAYAPTLDAQGNATWPQTRIGTGLTQPLVRGKLHRGLTPTDVCPAADIGLAHRVTTAQSLQTLITG